MSNKYMPIERYYALKAVFERVWGRGTYLELKNCTDLKVWKHYSERTLKATKMSASETVLVTDDDWHTGLSEIIQHGISSVKGAKSFDELFQCLAATYIEISFHQIGFMPSRYSSRSQLRKGHWRLDRYRTVQYVQNAEQKKNVEGKGPHH